MPAMITNYCFEKNASLKLSQKCDSPLYMFWVHIRFLNEKNLLNMENNQINSRDHFHFISDPHA